ncbi:hypothetical protein SAMN02800692_1847 [Luteibacter sp. UNC138MFCol5.1]|uniref:hypothetical protein n=1 Tax=Luteibacter sp. UNC138MFCol5.1 TaxID=1502774 RepID=UPI0008AD673A|nr:hypothetical protein [Luteibacter sp. UNC138MFCol5.1]SEO74292.1 hypothetical protein SAMN02800692_1847 [Luteibacter sp. UNC138MFCol5.1]
MNISRYLVAAFLAIAGAAHAQSTQKYFGYYGADYPIDFNISPGGSALPEMKDHINLYSILYWSGDESPAGRAATEAYVLDQLAKAKAVGAHAVVSAFPFLYKPSAPGSGRQVFDPSGVAAWQSLASKMAARGYIVPGDPARSTVVAVYLIDEPNNDDKYLWDVNGAANPNLVNVAATIRQTAETAGLPLAAVLTSHFKGFERGMQLLDWVGFDHYGDSDSEWRNTFNALKSLTPGKKYIVVPGAMQGCNDVSVEPRGRYFSAIENDASVTWIAPFAWFSRLANQDSCKGIRDIPSLRAEYTAEGKKIRDLQCASSPADKQFCAATTDISAALQLLLD